jgi:hypothetical protein
MPFKIKVNGVEHEVDVDGDIALLWVLRDVLGMTGTNADSNYTQKRVRCGLLVLGEALVENLLPGWLGRGFSLKPFCELAGVSGSAVNGARTRTNRHFRPT